MTPSAAWRLLEIDATADSKAIRRAYAAKLRAIDPDRDRDAFAALREARDSALAMAAQAVGGVEATDDAPASTGRMDCIEVILPCPPLPLAASVITATAGDFRTPVPVLGEDWQALPVAPGFQAAGDRGEAIDLALPQWGRPEIAAAAAAETDRPGQALYALLYPDPDAEENDLPMTDAEIASGRDMIDQVHADAHHGAIDLYARIEIWLAQGLAGAWPRSHPLLSHAADLFGWAAQEGQIDVQPAIDFVNRRLASDRFADAVRHKAHPLNSAWRQLSKPTRTGQSRALWWQGNKIDELLATIRRDHPEVERRLDWHRVAMWESHRARPIRWWTILVGVLFGLRIAIAIATAFNPSSPDTVAEPPVPMTPVAVAPRVPGGLGDVDADMKAAILATLGPDVTPEMLRVRVPLVLQLFESNWRLGLDMGRTRAEYVETMVGVIRNRYVLLARQAGGEPLIALQRQRLREERQLKGAHWRECAETGTHGGLAEPALLSSDLRKATQNEMAQLILAMPANPDRPAPGGTFDIPGKIVERTLETSGLTLDQLSAGFQGKGSDRERCLTHIALLDAALAADAETRAKLLSHI